ncbi:MAG TPA: endonuclease domain-containing protein [Longimicrobium sp.]|nr:endonuclease domain-containing protein [Longimicrobium sp.]
MTSAGEVGVLRHRYRNNSAELQIAAREMRAEPTPAERRLWNALRGSKLGVRFRRQHPVGQFILDFWCPEARLAVEVDGEVHDGADQQEKDTHRTTLLDQYGYKVIRFRNDEVLRELPSVEARLRDEIAARGVALPPSPAVREKGGRGG